MIAAALIKKILGWIPAILLLCLLGFFLLESVPGDPVMARMDISGKTQSSADFIYESAEYQRARKEAGLHLPVFYVHIRPATIPEKLFEIAHPEHRKAVKQLSLKSGQPQKVWQWYHQHRKLRDAIAFQKNPKALLIWNEIARSSEPREMLNQYQLLSFQMNSDDTKSLIISAVKTLQEVEQSDKTWLQFFPVLSYNGKQNRFHQWLFGTESQEGVIEGHLGFSLRQGRPVTLLIREAFGITLPLAIAAILLTYFISLPLGLKMAEMSNKSALTRLTGLLLMLFATPAYWLGILMLTFLCSPEFLNWFPVAYSLMNVPEDISIIHKTLIVSRHLILPVTCWSIGGVAFLSIQTFRKAKETKGLPFYMAARARGISNRKLIKNHLFPLAALPALSMAGSIIPAAVSGAVVIELIFSIPGIGYLMFQSFHVRDFPVVIGVLLVTGVFAYGATALSDLIQHLIDPRTRKRKMV